MIIYYINIYENNIRQRHFTENYHKFVAEETNNPLLWVEFELYALKSVIFFKLNTSDNKGK